MSIKPPSDLLLDVVKAADPAASAAAAERLAKIAGRPNSADPGFSSVLNDVETPPRTSASLPVQLPSAVAHARTPDAPVDAAATKAYQGLEALLLQNVVSTMLPDSADIFGEGSAGAIWRSMLAEQLGADLAKKVDLGIMPRYLRGHHSSKHESVSARAAAPALAEGHVIAPKQT